MTPLFQDFALGLAFVAPIGIQNLYVIRTAATAPWATSLRAATLVTAADILLGQTCLLGAGLLPTATPRLGDAVTIVSAGLMLYSGARLMLSSAPQNAGSIPQARQAQPSWRNMASSAFLVTWINPDGLLDGPLILGGFRAHLLPLELPYFATGLACASAAWFFGVTLGIGSFRDRIGNRLFGWMNLCCGAVLCLLAVRLGLNIHT